MISKEEAEGKLLKIYYDVKLDRYFKKNPTVAKIEVFEETKEPDEFDHFYGIKDDELKLGIWANNLENVQTYDEDQNPVGRAYNLFIEDVKVSDAAQTTAAIGFDYNLMGKTYLSLDYNYYANLYADYNPEGRTTEGLAQPWEVPAYGLVDASIKHGFKFGNFDATLIARVNNVFDTEYIADAINGADNDAYSALVWYGYGRTFNISAKINF